METRKNLSDNLPKRKIIEKMDYTKIIFFIIDNLEGGYYHPQMLADGRIKDQRYKFSGETLFGIDRRTGGTINTSEAGVKFWSIIDHCKASEIWRWNFKGGEYAPQLKELVSQMMLPLYNSLCKKYLSADSIKIINASEQLTFHFLYATWNGAGFFRYFATIINDSISKGIKKNKELVNICVNSRINYPNSLIKQGGLHIKDIISLLN